MKKTIAAVLMLSSTQAGAMCLERDTLANRLFEKHGESLVSSAFSAIRQMIVETFVNPEKLTYTIALIDAGDKACVVDYGTFYQDVTVEGQDL